MTANERKKAQEYKAKCVTDYAEQKFSFYSEEVFILSAVLMVLAAFLGTA